MKRKKISVAIILICVAAAVFFVWRFSCNGIRKQIASSECYFYKHGWIDREKNGLVYDEGSWWYVKDGRVDREYVGLVENSSGLWRVKDGMVDFSYEGFVRGESGWWYVEGGRARTDFTGICYGALPTDWMGGFYGSCISGSSAVYAAGEKETAGWWYVNQGRVTPCNTIVKEGSAWWCIRNGRIWFSYRGIAENENGKFYVQNGRVHFDRDGVFYQRGGTYFLESGKVTEEIHRDSTRFIAHRGLRSEAPENTQKAFELAGEAGFWGCETDVRLTADGQFVLVHDRSFSRMCGTEASPSDMTAEEIRQLVITNGAEIERWQGDPSATSIAFLEDYLEICLQYNMVPVIDIKFDSEGGIQQVQKLYECIRERLGMGEVVFIASDFLILQQLRQVLDESGDTSASLQFVIREGDGVSVDTCLEWGVEPNIKYRGLAADTLSIFRENGVKVNVWTVDDPYKIAFLLRQGADYITTNRKFW